MGLEVMMWCHPELGFGGLKVCAYMRTVLWGLLWASAVALSGLAFLHGSVETGLLPIKGSSSPVFAWLITSLLVFIDPTVLKPVGLPVCFCLSS